MYNQLSFFYHRTIEFEGVDCNMCCGTHVNNLSHLQIVKLLQVEKGKKGKSNLYFLAGNRVSKYVEEKWLMDKDITKSLKVFRIEQISI